MSIWTHSDSTRQENRVKELYTKSDCPYCKTPLSELQRIVNKNKPWDPLSLTGTESHVYACLACGWWITNYIVTTSNSYAISSSMKAAVATLKNLDLTDLSSPIEEIQTYLAAKYESRFEIHPRHLEDIVARVFALEHYSTRVTTYSNDGGIDVILDDPKNDLVGIQVKRYRSNVRVSQIREFVGALLIGGYTRGIFVTTSDFTKPAIATAGLAETLGYPIELIDSNRLFEALSIVQREHYRDKQELLEDIGSPNLFEVWHKTVPKPSNP